MKQKYLPTIADSLLTCDDSSCQENEIQEEIINKNERIPYLHHFKHWIEHVEHQELPNINYESTRNLLNTEVSKFEFNLRYEQNYGIREKKRII